VNGDGGSRATWTGKPERVGASGDASITYKEALAWLYSLQRFGIKLGLENIRRLIDELDIDSSNAHVIHVAGTNGKGSVCAMIDSICRAQKYRTGLFTSPHLVTFRERIRLNGEMISENEVAAGLTKIQALVAAWDPHPTFFEITTALALKHFADAKTCPERSRGVDTLILETGLGGRLDATNAVQSNVAVLTQVALDHEKWLGDSIEKIASEKAGIIKPKTPVISAPQPLAAAKVIRARAVECKAPLQIVDHPYTQSPIALRGEYQKLNAAIAIAAIRALKLDRLKRSSLPEQKAEVDDAVIARGLANVEWPARFQCWDKRTVIDGAHNPAAAKVLVQAWHEVFDDQRATLILAVLSDKDLREICQALAPISDSILLPKIRTERAASPLELQKIFVDLGHTAEITTSFGEAFTEARKWSAPILIIGSLHFAGEALAHLQGKPAAFEECAQ
jgi:dihydrofolate synthase / folylpolyglutamate synthase